MDSIYNRYGGGPLGGPAYRTDGFTEEQLQRREDILNAPLPESMTNKPYAVVDEFSGEIYYEQRNTPAVSLKDYQSSRSESFDRAFKQDNLVSSVFNYFSKEMQFSDSNFPPDPEFNLNDHTYVYDLVSPEFAGELNKATSYDELVARTQYYGKITKDLQYLDQLGAEGVGYRAAAFLTDLPMFASLDFIGAGIKMSQAGRLADFATAVERTYLGRAAVSGVIEGGFEGIKYAVAPHSRDEVDILLAIGLGGALGGLYKPVTYTKDVQDALIKPVKELANATAENGGKLAQSSAVMQFIENTQVNVASTLRRSPSQTLASFGDNMFLNPLESSVVGVKAAEVQTAVIDGIQAEFNRTFRPLYDEFLEATGRTSVGSRYRLTAQDEFYEIAGKIANQPNKNWDDVLPPELVSKIKAANEHMATASYDVLARNKHSMFTSGEIARGSYLPRRWNRAKLLEDINTGVITKPDAGMLFTTGIKNAVREAGLDIAEEKAIEAGKKFVKTLTKPHVPAGQADYIMQDNAFRAAFDDLAKMLDFTDDEYKLFEEALTKSRTNKGVAEGTASATRRRGNIDIEAEYISADGTSYSLSDYIENNVQTLWQSYGRQMGGDTALRAMGINSRAELGALRDKVVKELTDASGQMSGAAKRDLVNFDAVIGDLLNISGKHAPDSDAWKATRLVNNLVRSSKLGSTWFAMSAELAQVAHTTGVVNTIKAVPVINQLRRQLKGKNASALIDEIQSFYGLADEILQMPSAARYDDVLRGAGGKRSALTVAEEVSDRAAEAAYMLGGTKSGTSALEAVFATAANNKLVKMAGKQRLGAEDKWFLKQIGFDGEDVTRLMEAVRFSGSPDNKYVLGLSSWDDQDLAMKLAYGIRRASHYAIQRGNIGDQLGRFTMGGTLAKDNIMGALGLNLRNYMITAWNKQFGRMAGNFSRGGYESYKAFTNIVYQGVIVGGLGVMAKNGLDYATGAIDEETYDERMSPQAIAASTFNMTTFASILPSMVLDPAVAAVTGKGMSGQSVRGGPVNILGATGSYLADAQTAVGLPFKALDPDRELTANDIKKTLGLLPLASLIGVKQAIGALAEGVTE